MNTPTNTLLTVERDWKKITLTIPRDSDLHEMFENFDVVLMRMWFQDTIMWRIKEIENSVFTTDKE